MSRAVHNALLFGEYGDWSDFAAFNVYVRK